jgi:hypothetical protein
LKPRSSTEYVEQGSSAPGPLDAHAQAKRSKRVRPGWTRRGLARCSMVVFYSKTEREVEPDKHKKEQGLK